jgi:phosphatidate cytidylyltransferase
LARVLAEAGSSRSPRWGDLPKRVASACVLVPLALLCLYVGGWAWAALVALGAIGMAEEWRRMCARRGGAGVLALGLPYILPCAAALIWLRADEAGAGNVLFLLLVVWATDIGAYLLGRLVGGPKLAPAISPGKTWSGAAGGLAAAMLVGLAASLMDGFTPWHGALVAGGLAIVAELGDLLESRLKRYFGVKDSGALIPGHGGLLDRLDAMLTAAPTAALLAAMQGGGVELWR